MFGIRLSGKVGAQDVQADNMVVVIGAMNGAVATSLTRTLVGRRTVIAECFHIWRTQVKAIDDFHGLRMVGIGHLLNKPTLSTVPTIYCLFPDREPCVPVLQIIASCL